MVPQEAQAHMNKVGAALAKCPVPLGEAPEILDSWQKLCGYINETVGTPVQVESPSAGTKEE